MIEHTFVINLKDSTDRWEKYKETPYIRWNACSRNDVDVDTKWKMVSMYNYPIEKHLGRCACYLSHKKLLEHIVENQLNDVLILEDDAVKCDDIPTDYSIEGITYLGGFAHHKKMTNNEKISLDNMGKGIFKKGDFRILMTMSYIVPRWEIAEIILNFFNHKDRLRAIDIMYEDLPLPIYYKYPASFREDICPSTIDSSKSKRATPYYMWE
tara:strand:- start:5459 stop:6091 length:633 start_codon:yes stop_codon:yes gene_type:complete